MKVTYIVHSCYYVELEHCGLLFDYYSGPLPETDKPLYVFASHSHDDHFSPDVFRLSQPGKEVHYLLSKDIFRSRVPEELKESVTFVAPRQFYEVGAVRAATLRSTDQGVAFLVECEGKLLYHAGDLNCWVWDGAPRFQNDQMKRAYQEELSHLAGKHIDVAFVPLDPRQEADFDLGMKYFFEIAGADHVFPMHMWGHYGVWERLMENPEASSYRDKVMRITKAPQEFEIG